MNSYGTYLGTSGSPTTNSINIGAYIGLYVAPTTSAPGTQTVPFNYGSGYSANVITLSNNITVGTPSSISTTAASHGTVTSSVSTVGGNVVSVVYYTPTAGYAGADSFTYSVSNSGGTSNTSTVSVTVSKGNQTIASTGPAIMLVNGTSTVTATATSGLTVTLYNTTPGICGFDTGTGLVTALALGTCTITADQAGNGTYNAAPQVVKSIAVGLNTQTITIDSIPSINFNGTGTLAAHSSSGLALNYASTTGTICNVDANSGLVTTLAAGSCSITVSQTGNAVYASASVNQPITIGLGNQTVTIGAAPVIYIGASGPLTAAATSGLAVSFNSRTTSICTINNSSGLVNGIKAGTCSITVDQAGNANYSAAPQATLNFNILNVPATPAAATMSTALNTAATIDLTSFVTGTSITGIKVSTAPAHGMVTVNGFKATYTPKQDYFGTDSFAYAAFGAAGVSTTTAIVSITITGRPDPTQATHAKDLVSNQVQMLKRAGKMQLYNFMQRAESLHRAPDGRSVSTLPAFTNTGTSNTVPPAMNNGPSLSELNIPQNNLESLQQIAALSLKYNKQGIENTRQNNSADASPIAMMLSSSTTSLLSASTLNLGTISNAVQQNRETASEGFQIWTAGTLRFGTRTPGGSVAESSFSTEGVSLGADRWLNSTLALGLGIGYAQDKSTIGSDGSASKSHGNSFAVYASYQPKPSFFIDGLLGYGFLTFDTDRYVPAVDDFARAQRNGEQMFGSISTAYEFRKNGLLLSPYIRLDIEYARLNDVTEQGAGLNALYYSSQALNSSQLSLGGRIGSNHETSFGWAMPHARMEIQHGLEGAAQASVAYADDLAGTQYDLATSSRNTDSFVLGFGSDFLLRSGLKIGIDYQRLLSSDRENFQSLQFRLTKPLNEKNGYFPEFSEDWTTKGLVFNAGYNFDSNVTRASDEEDVLPDTFYSLTASTGKRLPISEHTQLAVNASANTDKYRTYTGLGNTSFGIGAELRYRSTGNYGSPTYGLFGRYFSDTYESTLRSGDHTAAGLSVRWPITDRINLFGAVANNIRHGNSSVFNAQDNSARLNIDYALGNHETFYLTGEYRNGDIISTGQPTLKVVDIATVFVKDDAFNSLNLYAYRMPGKTILTTIGWNVPFGERDSIDMSWRMVRATPDKDPSFATTSTTYTDNQYSIVYLMAF